MNIEIEIGLIRSEGKEFLFKMFNKFFMLDYSNFHIPSSYKLSNRIMDIFFTGEIDVTIEGIKYSFFIVRQKIYMINRKIHDIIYNEHTHKIKKYNRRKNVKIKCNFEIENKRNTIINKVFSFEVLRYYRYPIPILDEMNNKYLLEIKNGKKSN